MTISVEMVSTSSKLATVYLSCPPPGGLFSIYQNANYGLSYKAKKEELFQLISQNNSSYS